MELRMNFMKPIPQINQAELIQTELIEFKTLNSLIEFGELLFELNWLVDLFKLAEILL